MGLMNNPSHPRHHLAVVPMVAAPVPPQITRALEVVIPPDAFVELEHPDTDPHLAVYASRNAADPIIRIRVGSGPAGEREETAEAMTTAARQMHTALVNHSFLGGAS